MAKSIEGPVGKRAKVRGGLPGDSWRDHVSSGAERAYDTALAPARRDAAELRRKGRLVAAHRAEKRAYRIRARGYQRKYSPVDQEETLMGKSYDGVSKLDARAAAHGAGSRAAKRIAAHTPDIRYVKQEHKIGPWTTKRTTIRNKPLTKEEERRENMLAVGNALGGTRAVLAAAAGASGVAAVNEAQQNARRRTRQITSDMARKVEDRTVDKAFTVDDILSVGISKAYGTDLVGISKLFGSGLLKRVAGSSLGSGAGMIGGAAKTGFEEGGFKGATAAARQAHNDLGGMKGFQEAASSSAPSIGGHAGDAAKLAGGAAGVGLLGWGAKQGVKMGRNRLASLGEAASNYKSGLADKAKKAALYGAVGGTGMIAGGTALGNTIGN